jgi:L-lactate dehydrogenase complex protein LldE
VDVAHADLCCGFGGTFSVKVPEVSVAMADAKLDAAVAAGASAIVSTDPGCLMHLEGRARRRGLDVSVHHLVDLLEPGGTL